MTADPGPVFDQVNLVVRDMAAGVAFYRGLGVEVAPTQPAWEPHHRTLAGGAADLELDSAGSVRLWDAGWPAGRTGPVLGFRVATREQVDACFTAVTAAGYTGQQPPHDAFFGARYAVVEDPDGNAVGIMSPPDPARATAPEPPA